MHPDFHSYYQDCLNRVQITPDGARAGALQFSDVVLHLPVLEFLASQCSHVIEFGVREGNSTIALMMGLSRRQPQPGELLSVDKDRTSFVHYCGARNAEGHWPCKWTFIQGDTSNADLPLGSETDMIYFDAGHSYADISAELNNWARMVRPGGFLAFHDWHSCADRDVTGPDSAAKGIRQAILDFLAKFPGEYKTWYETPRCNGLLVLQRQFFSLCSPF